MGVTQLVLSLDDVVDAVEGVDEEADSEAVLPPASLLALPVA